MNRWSLIAGRLPGRTDNEIKNYWNGNLSKRVQGQVSNKRRKLKRIKSSWPMEITREEQKMIRPKAVKCTKAVDVINVPRIVGNQTDENKTLGSKLICESINIAGGVEGPSSSVNHDPIDFLMDFDVNIEL